MREISAEKAREKVAHETLTGIRRTIAERMSESWKAPHVNLAIQVNASELVRARQTLLPSFREKGGKVTYTDFLIEAVAKTIEKFPEVNSGYEEGSIKRFAEINIGVGVAIKDGLIVPVIHNANKKSLFEIAKEREELVKKARDRTLSKQDIEEGTFTLTNLGMYGIDFFTAVLNPPQAAELSVGRIDEKPVVEKGEMVIRPMMCLVLIIDHRVLDGAKGAEFLGELKKKIEAPRV
jgi:Pyruvate/2-oxoglutarate dehydrogenase complex, dihydrolipoamide acyltransferase (E2) component, and related enzymes